MATLGDGRIVNIYKDRSWSTRVEFDLSPDQSGEAHFGTLVIDDLEQHFAPEDLPTVGAALALVLQTMAAYCASEYSLTLSVPELPGG